MEEDNDLHFEMLEYLYNTRKLPMSVYGAVWDDFRAEHENYQHFASEDLKITFWKIVMYNLDQYEIENDSMLEYFTENLFLNPKNEDLQESLTANEPKGDGKDFQFVDNPDDQMEVEEASGGTSQDPIFQAIQNAFEKPKTYTGTFGFQSDSEIDKKNCVKICSKAPEPITEKFEEGSFIRTFNALRTLEDPDPNKIISAKEIRTKLRDPNALSIAHLKKLPAGVKEFMSKYPKLKTIFAGDEATNDENVHSDMESIETDWTSTASGETSTDNPSTSSSAINSESLRSASLRSNLDPLSMKRASAVGQSQSHSTPSRKPRSRKEILVPNPAENPRMKEFVKKMVKPKRRRDSTSPT